MVIIWVKTKYYFSVLKLVFSMNLAKGHNLWCDRGEMEKTGTIPMAHLLNFHWRIEIVNRLLPVGEFRP